MVDETGTALTQRDIPAMVLIQPLARAGGGLVLRTPGMPDLDVPEPAGVDLVDVTVWKDTLAASPAGTPADDWLSAALDRKVRLVWLDDPTRRVVNPEYGEPGDRVGFADGYPLLLANAASLDAVNGWLVESGSIEGPLPMTRFRPNVVISGAPPWAEDEWVRGRIRIGGVAFRVAKPCDRCVVTTTDQETGERGHEPLRVLGRHRNVGQKLLFGVNLIPDAQGPIAVGDPIEVP
ncbi:MAG TPA: MOSC domain-containing protein, partial [Pilimelia sp.]|nr:MOSC domain-containing protein [Pilimelia sp.]